MTEMRIFQENSLNVKAFLSINDRTLVVNLSHILLWLFGDCNSVLLIAIS